MVDQQESRWIRFIFNSRTFGIFALVLLLSAGWHAMRIWPWGTGLSVLGAVYFLWATYSRRWPR